MCKLAGNLKRNHTMQMSTGAFTVWGNAHFLFPRVLGNSDRATAPLFPPGQ
jgi:hypothetical protein